RPRWIQNIQTLSNFLPLRYVYRISVRAEEELTMAEGSARTVMVVDDDDDLRETITARLVSRGFSVTQAANGQEALEQIDKQMPSLIILDMKMPVMDGWEF